MPPFVIAPPASGNVVLPPALVFDVRQYGAVGDSNGNTGNGTDNLAAFNTAIAACKAAGGGVLYFPRGIYRIAAPRILIDFGGVTIMGAGRRASQLVFDGIDSGFLGGLVIDGYTLSPAITHAYVYGVHVEGITTSMAVGAATLNTPYTSDPRMEGRWAIGFAAMFTARGVVGLSFDDLECRNGPASFLSCLHDCQDVTGGSLFVTDGLADGLHIMGGCKRVAIDRVIARNVGDDAVAVGYQVQAEPNEDISIGKVIASGVGACGIALYGPLAGFSLGGFVVNTTWNSGIKIAPVSMTGTAASASAPVTVASSVTDVSIAPGVLRNIGMRDKTLYNRGDGIAAGIALESGGTISNVAIASGQIMDNVRNAFVVSNGTTPASVILAPGSIYANLVSGGAGAASQGGGYSRDMGSGYVTVAEYVPVAAVSNVIAADNLNAANAAPSANPFSTATGGKTVSPGNGALIGFSGGKQVFGAGAGYPIALLDTGVITHDITIACHGSETIFLGAGSDSAGGDCVIASMGGGGLYARKAGVGPINGSNSPIAPIPAGDHTFRLRLTATQAMAYLDGSSTPLQTINLPTSGWSAGTFVFWGIETSNSIGPTGTGFNQLSVVKV